MPDDKKFIEVASSDYLKKILYSNDPRLLGRIQAYKEANPNIDAQSIRLKIYDEVTQNKISDFSDPINEIGLVERGAYQIFLKDSGLGVNDNREKDELQNNFKLGYDTDGSFKIDFDINAVGKGIAYDKVIDAYKKKYPDTRLTNLSNEEKAPDVQVLGQSSGNIPMLNLSGMLSNEKKREKKVQELSEDERNRFNSFAMDYYLDSIKEKQKKYVDSPWLIKRAEDFSKGFFQGLDMTMPIDMKIDDNDERIQELMSTNNMGVFNKKEEKTISDIDKYNKTIVDDIARQVTQAVGTSSAFMLGTMGLGEGILTGLANKYKPIAGMLEAMKSSKNTLGSLLKGGTTFGKYLKTWGARVLGSGIMGTYNIPGGIESYFSNVPDSEKGFGRFLYEGILSPIAETMSEGLLVETRFGSKLGQKALDYVAGVPINMLTEETTNLLQDYFTNSKTSILNGWGEAQTGALGMSLIFGTGGAMITSADYGLNYSQFSKDMDEAIGKFVGSNKYKLAKRLDGIISNSALPENIKQNLVNANEKAKTFYMEMLLGDTDRTIKTKKNGQDIEIGFKTLPKNLQDAIVERVNKTLPSDATELEKRVLIGREIADVSIFNIADQKDDLSAIDISTGMKKYLTDNNKINYNREVDAQRIKELTDKIYKAQENNVAGLADYVRKEALNDKLDLTSKDIMNIVSDISLNPGKTINGDTEIDNLKRKASDYYNGFRTSKADAELLLNKGSLTDEEFSKLSKFYEDYRSLEETTNILVGEFLQDDEYSSKKKITKEEFNEAVSLIGELEGKEKIVNMKNKVALVEYLANTYDVSQSETSAKNQLALKAIRALNKYYSTTDKSYEIIERKTTESKEYHANLLRERYSGKLGDSIYLQDTVSITDEFMTDTELTDFSKVIDIADRYAKTDGTNEAPYLEELLSKDSDPGLKDSASKYLNSYKQLYDAKNTKVVAPTKTLETSVSVESKTTSSEGGIPVLSEMTDEDISIITASAPTKEGVLLVKKYADKLVDYFTKELEGKTNEEKITFLTNYFNSLPKSKTEYIGIRDLAIITYLVNQEGLVNEEASKGHSVHLLNQHKQAIIFKGLSSAILKKLEDGNLKDFVNDINNSLTSLAPQVVTGSNFLYSKVLLLSIKPVMPISKNVLLKFEGLEQNGKTNPKTIDYKDIITFVNILFEAYDGNNVHPIYELVKSRLESLEGDKLKAVIGQLYHLLSTTSESDIKIIGLQKDVDLFKSAISTTLDIFIQQNQEKLKDNIVNAYGKLLYNSYKSYKNIEELFSKEENFNLLVEFGKIYESKRDITAFMDSDAFKQAFGEIPINKDTIPILRQLGYKFFSLNGLQVYPYDKFKKLTDPVSRFISDYLQYFYNNSQTYLDTLRLIKESNPKLKVKRGAGISQEFWLKSYNEHIALVEDALGTESLEIKTRVTIKKELEDLAKIAPTPAMGTSLIEVANRMTLDLKDVVKSSDTVDLETFASERGFKIKTKKLPNGNLGVFTTDGTITITKGLSDSAYQIVLGHEIGHGLFKMALDNEVNSAIKTDLDKIGKYVYDLLNSENIPEEYKEHKDRLLRLVLDSEGKYSLDEFIASSTSVTDKLFNEFLNSLASLDGITEVEKKNNLFEQLISLMRKILDFIMATDKSAGSQVKMLLDGLELSNEFNKQAPKPKSPKIKAVKNKTDEELLSEFDDIDKPSFFPGLTDLLTDDGELIQAQNDYYLNPNKKNLDKLNSLTEVLPEELDSDLDQYYFPTGAIEPLLKEKVDFDGDVYYSFEHWDSIVRNVCDMMEISVDGKTVHDFFKTFQYEDFLKIFTILETDTDKQKTAKTELLDSLKEKADFKHAYKVSSKDIVQAKIKELYNRLTSLSRVQMLKVTVNNRQYSIEKLPDEYKNDAGAFISNIKSLAVINHFIPTLSKMLGLNLELQQIDSFSDGENSGYREAGIEARELAHAFNREGIIYLNRFADKNTYPVLSLTDNIASKDAMNKIWVAVKPFYDRYVQSLGEEGYEFYDSNNVSSKEKSIIITQTVRTILEDLKLGTSPEEILSGQTRLKGRDFVQLMKRWVLASITSKMTYTMDEVMDFEKEMFNGKPLISSDPNNPIYYKIEDGKPRIYVRSVILKTKGIDNPLLKNSDGAPRYDGGSICLLGQLDKVLRHSVGSVNKGIMKNFFYNDGTYLKHAIHQMSAKDNWGYLFAKNNIAFLSNDECEKNQLGGDKYEPTTWEELNDGNAKVIDLPLDGFNRIKENASFKEEVLGFAQVCNACGIVEENPWIDSEIPKIIRKYVESQAKELNEYSEEQIEMDVFEKVESILKEPSTYMDNVFKSAFQKKLKPYIDGKQCSNLYALMKIHSEFTPVKEALKSIMNKPIRNAVKLAGDGTKVTLTMDAGNLSGTRTNAIKNAIKEKFGEENLEEKLKEYVDENGFLKEDYGVIDSLTATRMGIKPFDKVVIYITPTDSAMGVKAVEVVGIVSNDDMPLSAMVVNSEYIQGVGKDYDIDEFTLLTNQNFQPEDWDKLTNGLMKINQVYRKETKRISDSELKRETNPFNSKDQLAFMQSFLGINKAIRPQESKYHILEKEGITVGDMFYKNIGEVVRLRELHQLLSQLNFKTEFEFKNKKYEVNINNKDWGKIHYMLLVATNDMVDYPKNNNKDYYNSDTRNMFAKIINSELKYNSPSDLLLLEGKDLSYAKDMNKFIEQLYDSFLGMSSPLVKLFSIPRFKNNSFGKTEYDKAKAITALKKIKSLQSTLKTGTLFAEKSDSSPLVKFFKNISFEKENIYKHPIAILIGNINVKKLNDRVNTFYTHKDYKEERAYNTLIEGQILKSDMIKNLFGIDNTLIPQMLESAKNNIDSFLPFEENKKLDKIDQKEYGIFLHKIYFNMMKKAVKDLNGKNKPIYDSDILLETNREFFGAEGQTKSSGLGIMRIPEYKYSNPKLVTFREDIRYFFKTGGQGNTELTGFGKTSNYPKVIGMLALKALDRLNPIDKAVDETSPTSNTLEMENLILKKNNKVIQIIDKESGESTTNGKIKVGSKIEKALLDLNQEDASKINKFLNLQENNISTNVKLALAEEYMGKVIAENYFTQKEINMVLFTHLGLPTFPDWGKHTSYGTSTSNANLFILASRISPDFMSAYIRRFREAKVILGDLQEIISKDQNLLKSWNDKLDEGSDVIGEYNFPMTLEELDEMEGVTFDTPQVDTSELLAEILSSNVHQLSDYNKANLSEIKELAFKDKPKAIKKLLKLYNEVTVGQLVQIGRIKPEEVKSMDKAKVSSLIASNLNSTNYKANVEAIKSLKDAYKVINVALSLNKIIDSSKKKEWTTLDKVVYSDLHLNVDVFGRLAPQTYLTSDSLPLSLKLNFNYNPTKESGEQEYYLETSQIFDRLQTGYKDLEVAGIKALSLVDIIHAKQQLIDNNLTYIKNLFSTHIKNKVNITLKEKTLDEELLKKKQFFDELERVNQIKKFRIQKSGKQMIVVDESNNKVTADYVRYAEITYPGNKDKQDILIAVLHMKEMLSYHMPRFVGSLLRYMSMAEKNTQNAGERERIHRIVLKYSRVYNYMRNGFSNETDIKEGNAPLLPFIPKAYSKEAWVHGYVMMNKEKAIKEQPTKTKETVINELEEKATEMFGNRSFLNPLFFSPKYYKIENESRNFDVTMTGFMEDLLRNAKEDLTLINWYTYRNEAIRTNMPHFVTDKMVRWFKNLSTSNQISNELKNKATLKKGDYIFFRREEEKEEEQSGLTYFVKFSASYGGRIESLDGNRLKVKIGESIKEFELNKIYTENVYGDRINDKVEVLSLLEKATNESEVEKIDTKFQKALEGTMSTWILLTRGYLNALPSKVRNVLGGRISGVEEYMPLFTRLLHMKDVAPENIQKKLAEILNHERQSTEDVNSSYYKALAEVSSFGSKTILDMFSGGGLTELSNKELPIPEQNLLSKIKFFRELVDDVKTYDAFIEARKSIYSEMNQLNKEDQRYKELASKLNLLTYEQQLNEQQLQDRLLEIQNDADIKKLYPLYKKMVESGNLGFKYSITSDMATKLYKEHMKESFVDKRMEFVNKDEGLLRTVTFQIAFVEEYERSRNLDKSLIYAQNAVKRQHAFYSMLSRVFAHGKAQGRVLNALRHYTFNKLQVLKTLFKDTKEVKDIYGWKVLAKSVFSRDIRINGDEVEIFGKDGEIAQYSPVNRLANMIGFNIFLYNLGSIIPGVQFVGNPVIMAVLGLTDVIVKSLDPDDEDNPTKVDMFYALAQALQLRGGVGKNWLYSSLIHYWMYEEGDNVGDIAMTYAPGSLRQAIKFYNLGSYLSETRTQSNALKIINSTAGMLTGFKYMDFNYDMPKNSAWDELYSIGVPFSNALERLATSPVERQVKRQIEDRLDIDSFLDNLQKRTEELKRGRKERFNLLNPLGRLGEYK